MGDGPGSLACCSSWCHKGLDMTELNRSLKIMFEMARYLQICSSNMFRGMVGRKVGGMFRWNGTCVNPWLIHVDVW